MIALVRIILILACLSAAFPAFAEKRVALVIGNSAYTHAPPLANPKNDAEGVAAALQRLDFDVLSGVDLDKPRMERLLQAFAAKLDRADVALVFYAGHGLQVQGRNYLVPVDGKLDRESDLLFQAVPLDLVQSLLEQSQRTNILILDACRDNPLARNLARTMGTRSTSIGRGLGEAKAGVGTLIVYATQPGNVALDGDEKNSPFTAALLKHMEVPGLEVRQVLTRVRNDVITLTRDKQVPWDSSSLRGDFFFKAAAARPETAPAAGPEVMFWQGIRDSRSIGDFKAYLERWPNGIFAALARARIVEIERAAADEAKRAEEQRKKAAEDQRADAERKARDDARQDAERKRNQADAVARIAGQRLDRAKAVLRQNNLADARRLADECAALAKEAAELSPASMVAQAVGRDLAAFRRDLDTRIGARVAVLLREARGLIGAKKFADAEKRIEDAEELSPAAATAARRELETARDQAEADVKKRAEEAARKKAAEEEKKAEELKPAAPDPKKQAQTGNSWYAPERKRGLIAFAHRKSTLEPGAVAALERLVASLQGQKDYKITLVATADRSEGTAAELLALSRGRLAAIQNWMVGKGIAGAAIRTGIAASRGEGPAFRMIALSADVVGPSDRNAEAAKPDARAIPSRDFMRHLVGAEWRGTLSSSSLSAPRNVPEGYYTRIRFGPGGLLQLTASTAGSVTGAMDADDRGSWSAFGANVCVRFARIGRGQQQCYGTSLHEEGGVVLSGSGLLAGKRFSK